MVDEYVGSAAKVNSTRTSNKVKMYTCKFGCMAINASKYLAIM